MNALIRGIQLLGFGLALTAWPGLLVAQTTGVGAGTTPPATSGSAQPASKTTKAAGGTKGGTTTPAVDAKAPATTAGGATATTPSGTTPSGTTPSGTTPSGTTPSGTAPGAATTGAGKTPAAATTTSASGAATAGTTAAGTASPATGAAAADEAAPPTMDGSTYRVRLRDLEQQVDELKEQIRRSHTRLSLLSDTILSGAGGGARAEVEFVNDLSGAWRLVEAVFVLDGAVQYKKTDDSGVLAAQKTIPIFSGSIPTGDHTLQVMLKLRGHGFGVFSYLSGLEAVVRHDHSFTLTDGKVYQLRATAWEQGGPTTPVEEQPDIRFNETIRSMSDTPPATPASTKAMAPVDASVGARSTGTAVDTKATVGGGN